MNAPIHNPGAGTPLKRAVGPRFVHLKVHSAYSLLEGALPIGKLAKLAVAYEMPALALTDTNNLFGALEFSDKLAAAGVQPIVGVSLAIDFQEKKPDRFAAASGALKPPAPQCDGLVALLAMNDDGYANLMKLVSLAHLGVSESESPHTTADQLAAHGQGLIVLTGGPQGPVDGAIRDGQLAVAKSRLTRLAALAGDRLYVELQRHSLPMEAAVEPQIIALAYEMALPLVATNEAYFGSPSDYEAHDALICIAEGSYVAEDNRRRLSPEHYFKPAKDMCDLFSDLPEAPANTV